MSVVGIDPSLAATGLAIIPTDVRGTAAITLGRKGQAGEGWGQRSDRIVAQVRRVCSQVPDHTRLVVIESMPQRMAKPLPSFGDRWAVWFGIYSTLRSRGIPVAVVMPSTRALWATGKGNAKKAEVLSAVREQWSPLRIRDDNQADALVLASMGAHHLGWPLPFETKPRHTTGLEAIEWPEGVGA